jgi:hypothetical protein
MGSRASLAIVAWFAGLASCSPGTPGKEPAPTSIEVRLGSATSELVGARWHTKDDGTPLMATGWEELERVRVSWDGEHGFELPAKLVTLSQSGGFIQHVEVTPLEHPLAFHQALQYAEDFVAAHGAQYVEGFAEKAQQWRQEDVVIEITLHPNPVGPPTPTYSSDSRILRANFPGGQMVELIIQNVYDQGWIVSVSVFKDLPER